MLAYIGESGMREIKPELFAFVCYQVLMANGQGLKDKSPDYMTEKMEMLNDGWDAIGRLDSGNQAVVLQWMHKWNIVIPDEVALHYQQPNYQNG